MQQTAAAEISSSSGSASIFPSLLRIRPSLASPGRHHGLTSQDARLSERAAMRLLHDRLANAPNPTGFCAEIACSGPCDALAQRTLSGKADCKNASHCKVATCNSMTCQTCHCLELFLRRERLLNQWHFDRIPRNKRILLIVSVF